MGVRAKAHFIYFFLPSVVPNPDTNGLIIRAGAFQVPTPMASFIPAQGETRLSRANAGLTLGDRCHLFIPGQRPGSYCTKSGEHLNQSLVAVLPRTYRELRREPLSNSSIHCSGQRKESSPAIRFMAQYTRRSERRFSVNRAIFNPKGW